MGMLDGKVAFITGSGIGKGAAVRFAQESAKVAIADREAEEDELARAEIEKAGAETLFVSCDVSEPASVESAILQTVDRFGRLDIVFANAGTNGFQAPLDEIAPEEWDRTLGINLKGTFLTLRFAISHLKQGRGGSVLITSSSKAAQVTLMKMAALELGRHNIRVNAICPGAIHTNIDESTEQRHTEQIGITVEMPDGSPALNSGQGEPVDVADTCLFLASDLSRHVSGVDIFVDGGASLLRQRLFFTTV